MSKSKIALAAGLVLAVASPAMAERLSKEQLIALAIERETCGKDLSPIDAYYQSDTVILVTCGDATGFVPLAGGLGLGAGAVSILPEPQALGLDLMLPAFAAAMTAAMVRVRADLVPVVVGAGTALVLSQEIGPAVAIIGAGLAGGAVAALMFRAPA